MIDIAKIKVKAGKGGDGRVSFRREKYIAKGGPDGGDGGKGGSVYIEADPNKATLLDFRSKPIYEAFDGGPGGKKNMTGSDGEDLYVRVPVGTLIYEVTPSEEILVGDMIKGGEILLIARGGSGGKGNDHFKSSRNRTPYQFTAGKSGEQKEIKLEVKLLADIGLIGLPNAGKSTLINQLTSANAKVGNYPFTTLTPNLGIARLKDGKTAVVADIPGLIEGASEGKGLGDEFLRHVERTRILVHLIDGSALLDNEDFAGSVYKKYQVIREELSHYSRELTEKSEITVLNKIDIPDVKDKFEEVKELFHSKGLKIIGLSSLTGEGLDTLRSALTEALSKAPERKEFIAKKPVKVYNIETLPNRRVVFNDEVKEQEHKRGKKNR